MNEQEIRDFLADFRNRLEQAWSLETASSNLPWGEGHPLSNGQCSASSIVLVEELRNRFPNVDFKIALGSVYDVERKQPAIPLHVWIQAYNSVLDPSQVIDLAADQYEHLDDTVIFTTITDTLDQYQLIYSAWNLLEPDEMKKNTRKRAEILKKNLA